MWSVIALLLLPAYNYYLNGIIQFQFQMGSVSAFSYILMALIGAWGYLQLIRLKKNSVLVIFAALLIGTIFSYIIYPDIREALMAPGYNPLDSQAAMLFLYCVPAMILSNELPNWERTFDIIAKFSMVLVPIGILSYYVQLQTRNVMEINYMSISTNLVLPVCALSSYGYIHRKWYPFLIALAGIVFIFICGSRGAMLCTVLCLIFCLFRMFRHSGGVYRLFMTVIVFVLIGYLGQSFIQFSESAADSGFGRGRTLELMEEGSFFESAGRDEINIVIDSGIARNPFGYGLFGDRHVMVQRGLPATYCHNIIREFLCDFGVLIGTILLIYLVYMLYKSNKSIKDPYAYEILVTVTFVGLIHLLASGTFLADIAFWTMVGILLNPYIRLYNSTV